MSARVVRVGTIEGRHPMPVELYLLGKLDVLGQSGYDLAYSVAQDVGRRFRYEDGISEVELYYTGLTEVTIGAIDGFESMGLVVTPMRFDSYRGVYRPLRRKSPTRELSDELIERLSRLREALDSGDLNTAREQLQVHLAYLSLETRTRDQEVDRQ